MATNGTSQQQSRKMDFKPVDFDIHNIAPDAPVGEWVASIPRGKCKVQPTKEDRYPMLIVPVRLDSTEEEGEDYEKALGSELSAMVVFFDDAKPKAARMSKVRLRQICEAADVDLDIIPKKLYDPVNDLEPLINALEGKKLTVWTKHNTRKDTGETVTDLLFQNPKGMLKGSSDDDEEEEDEKPRKPAAKGAKGRRS